MLNTQGNNVNKLWVLIISLAVAVLTACGFSPVYKEGSQVGKALHEIRLADPTSEIGFKFLPQMQRKFPQATDATMNMNYSISLAERELGDRNIVINAHMSYNLTDLKSGLLITSGQVSSNTSFTSSTSIVGDIINESSRDQALNRLAEMLAQAAYHEIIMKLAAIKAN